MDKNKKSSQIRSDSSKIRAKEKMKQGQVTIFVVLGIAIVALIGLFFIFRTELPSALGGETRETNPSSFLEDCLGDKVQEAVEILGRQGGDLEPDFYKTFKFNYEDVHQDVSYLCYVQNFYVPCINQQPLLKRHLQEEIKEYISEEADYCFTELTRKFEGEGYEVSALKNGFEVTLAPSRIIININNEISLTKAGQTTKKENFEVVERSEIYGLADVAQEIVSQQAKYCSFNELGYMILYPEWSINEFMSGDYTVIYTLKNRKTQEMFRFATRGCAIPAGF